MTRKMRAETVKAHQKTAASHEEREGGQGKGDGEDGSEGGAG